jgi:hypothetical protein
MACLLAAPGRRPGVEREPGQVPPRVDDPSPVPLVVHIVSVIVYAVLGAFQSSAGIRRRRMMGSEVMDMAARPVPTRRGRMPRMRRT